MRKPPMDDKTMMIAYTIKKNKTIIQDIYFMNKVFNNFMTVS